MKIRIEVVGGLEEDEVVIRCNRVDETVNKIHQFVLDQNAARPKIAFYKGNEEFYFPLDEVLFFETEAEQVYAHTAQESYRIRYRLYELEEILPRQFIRAAKSSVVNINKIYSIKRDLTASSLVQFFGTHKQVYVSRHYYRALRKRLDERSNYEAK